LALLLQENVSRPLLLKQLEEDTEECFKATAPFFAILNDIYDLVLGCFYNFVIKPPDKL
jgi:hypothetical protein